MKNIDEILKAVGATAEFLFGEVTNIHQKANFGDTPLHIVCGWGDTEAVDALIEAGADVNAIGEAKMTPLFSAVMGNSVEVVQRLLEAGANPLVKNEDGRIVLDFAQNVKDESNPDSAKLIAFLKAATLEAQKRVR